MPPSFYHTVESEVMARGGSKKKKTQRVYAKKAAAKPAKPATTTLPVRDDAAPVNLAADGDAVVGLVALEEPVAAATPDGAANPVEATTGTVARVATEEAGQALMVTVTTAGALETTTGAVG